MSRCRVRRGLFLGRAVYCVFDVVGVGAGGKQSLWTGSACSGAVTATVRLTENDSRESLLDGGWRAQQVLVDQHEVDKHAA